MTATARPPFDWSTVEWTTTDGHPASGTRLQSTQIGPNTWWRVASHDYTTGADTELYRYYHESYALKAYRWITGAQGRADSLVALKERITTGWTVDITDHGYIMDSREGASVERLDDGSLILRLRRARSSQGRSFLTMHLTWDGDMEADGNTVHLYRVPASIGSRSTPGVPTLVKTFRFHPPRD